MSLMANMVASFLMFLVSANGQRGYCDKDFVISSWPTWLHGLMFLVSAHGLNHHSRFCLEQLGANSCLVVPPGSSRRQLQLPSRASGELLLSLELLSHGCRRRELLSHGSTRTPRAVPWE